MANELVPMSDIEKMANAVAASGLFGSKSREHAMALMLIAQSEGLHPMAAVQQFHIINGQPSRKSWSMLERFQAAGGRVEWHERTDAKVSATFSHAQGGSVKIDWDMKRAQQAGINNPMWKKYPRQMLTARVISEGVRTVFPGATGGFYVEEEVADMKDVTPPRRADGRAMPSEPAKIDIVDQETGEVLQEADPFANLQSDNIGPSQPPLDDRPPPLPQPTTARPGVVSEADIDAAAERAEAWANAWLPKVKGAKSIAALVKWKAEHADEIERCKAANLNAYGILMEAVQATERTLERAQSPT